MKRVLWYALITLLAGAHLSAQPAWAQKRGYDGDGREVEVATRDKTPLYLRYAEFSKAMAWELKTGKERSEQIHQILMQFRRKAETAADQDKAIEAQIRSLRTEMRKTNKADNRERAEELRDRIRELERKATPMNPEMFYAIAEVLSEPLLTDFWQIADRFTGEGKIHSGARYLEVLAGLKLTEAQGVAISLHYKTYLAEMWNADNGSPDSLKAVQTSFLDRLLEELTKEQQAAFQEAMATHKPGSKKRKEESKNRW